MRTSQQSQSFVMKNVIFVLLQGRDTHTLVSNDTRSDLTKFIKNVTIFGNRRFIKNLCCVQCALEQARWRQSVKVSRVGRNRSNWTIIQYIFNLCKKCKKLSGKKRFPASQEDKYRDKKKTISYFNKIRAGIVQPTIIKQSCTCIEQLHNAIG